MVTVFSGNISSLFIVIPFLGLLSLISPRLLSIFPIKIGYTDNYSELKIRKSLLYSLFISIGFMLVLFILGIVSIISPIVAKCLYLVFCIVIMREGMQLTGIVKVGSIISSLENSYSSALFIGTFGGFLSYRIMMWVLNIASGFMAGKMLLGIIILGVYAIGQCILLLSLEVLVAVAQYIPLYSNSKHPKDRNKLIKTCSGLVLICMGFVLSYFGFSY